MDLDSWAFVSQCRVPQRRISPRTCKRIPNSIAFYIIVTERNWFINTNCIQHRIFNRSGNQNCFRDSIFIVSRESFCNTHRCSHHVGYLLKYSDAVQLHNRICHRICNVFADR